MFPSIFDIQSCLCKQFFVPGFLSRYIASMSPVSQVLWDILVGVVLASHQYHPICSIWHSELEFGG